MSPWLAVAVLCAVTAVAVPAVRAQDDVEATPSPADTGALSTPEEMDAVRALGPDTSVRARERAQAVLRKNPNSFVAYIVLGLVEDQNEGNFPRAVFYLEKALSLYESKYGKEPVPAVWKWYSLLLRSLADAHGNLSHHQKKIDFIDRYNKLFDPDMIAERAWPLMQLGRYEDARKAAALAMQTGLTDQRSAALNAICATEFEAGHILASYDACQKALEDGRERPGGPNAVDLSNFAEASRSMFKLDEAERIALEATQAEVAWYGSPWGELADLYTRQGRFAEAFHALLEQPGYRMAKPTHVRDADRNEGRRSLSAFYLVIGRADEALRITDKAMVSPDRRAHQSRDPGQDLLITALLDRSAHLLMAERILEDGAGKPFYLKPWTWMRARWHRVRAWLSGRQAVKLLDEKNRLVGAFKIGTKDAAVMPPWLVGDVVSITGPGLVSEAISRARAKDDRPGAPAYYDAFGAEAAWVAGDEEKAKRLGERALATLNQSEALLRARVSVVVGEALWDMGKKNEALGYYDGAFQIDPGVFRRMGVALPVSPVVASSGVADDVADVLMSSPRFFSAREGFRLQVDADGAACLRGAAGNVIGCAKKDDAKKAPPPISDGEDAATKDETKKGGKGAKTKTAAKAPKDERSFEARLAAAFHQQVFAPRVDMSQADVTSLDGSNHVSRDPLEGLRPGD